ncbi:MAG: L,D-transpeptidase, partial [Solirubrobacterales bacterium]
MLRTRSIWTKGALRLLVLKEKEVNGDRWLKLRLPTRPNNSSGWVPASRTRMISNPWLVRVNVKKKRVRIMKRGREMLEFRAVVGAPATPTPRGLFAIYERVRQPDPSGFLGPFALHLT